MVVILAVSQLDQNYLIRQNDLKKSNYVRLSIAFQFSVIKSMTDADNNEEKPYKALLHNDL